MRGGSQNKFKKDRKNNKDQKDKKAAEQDDATMVTQQQKKDAEKFEQSNKDLNEPAQIVSPRSSSNASTRVVPDSKQAMEQPPKKVVKVKSKKY